MPYYAYFQGFHGDVFRDGKQWVRLDSFSHVLRSPSGATAATRRSGTGALTLEDFILVVDGLTNAALFNVAMLSGKLIPVAEISITRMEGTQEYQCILIRMQNVIITSTSPRPSGQQLEITYGKLWTTYTAAPKQSDHPLATQLSRLRRA